jgi:putative transposase
VPDWPHSPTHQLDASGAYIITAGTYRKQAFFGSSERLAYLCESLLQLAARYEWRLQAWAVFPNHYHFVAISTGKTPGLARLISHLHTVTAKEVNRWDKTAGRKVWFQYWDSHITYQKSYLARLNYVHGNAVRHGLVRLAEQYEWCSAGWFRRRSDRAFYQTVMRIRSEGIKVMDEFEVGANEIA